MEWVERLRGNVIALDTAPLIYFIEDHERYAATLQPFFEAVDRSEFRVVTSVITLLEVLVHPLRAGDIELARQYRDTLLHSDGLSATNLTPMLAEQAARLRAAYGIRTPDAIQIATALSEGAHFLLTNDRRLASVDELEVLLVDDLAELS